MTSSTPLPNKNVVLIDAATLQKPQRQIAGCEACRKDAVISFDNILESCDGLRSERDGLHFGSAGQVFACGGEINEKTLVELGDVDF
jgi:hypothetical protein